MRLDTLKDKVALITGASRGIGRASTIAFAKEGTHVVVTARNSDELESLVKECQALGVKALAVPADAAQEADVLRVKNEALKAFPQIDILVNNAGVAKYALVGEHTAADYDWMMNTNMRSTFLFTHAFLPEMIARKSGAIIIVSSQAGLRGFAGEAVYCATKFAQVGFAQALDGEVREHNIKVSVIAPGGVHTDFAIGTGRTRGEPKLQKMLEAEDVADAVVFAAAQPIKSRVMLVGMRPMSESL
ncbi:MAG: SDR family oxidoreductase [Anaerolineae bacterium]|nr:SDR family oxidoreductase [Anaerolineae bacterium]